MKTMSVFFLTVVLLLPSVAFSQARQYPDSIRVELPDQGAIAIFELRMYAKDKDVILTFPTRLTEVVNHIKKSLPQSQLRERHIVDVAPDKINDEKKRSHIVITKKKEDVTRLRVEETTILELLPPGWEIIIRTERSIVHVYVPEFADLEAISKMNFQPVVTHLATEKAFVNPARMGVFTRVVMQNEKVSPAGTPGHRLPADMLGLHPGAGVGLAGDRFYPEFNFLTAIYLANRFSKNRQRIAAGYELKLFSDRTEENAFSVQPVSFLTLSYGINFSSERPHWTALGVGYMVHNKSDIFRGKTLKIFFESDIGSDKLNIVPELYLTDDFKKSVFGIKLNYKF
jgi:hypothetical protein